MKRTFITSTLILILFVASAQKPQIGILAGATLSNFKDKPESEELTADSKMGYTAGLIANFGVAEKFTLQSGLHFVQKGSKAKGSIGGSTVSGKLISNWLEVPLNFMYNTANFFVGAGPSLSFGVGGKWEVEFEGEKESGKVRFGNTEDDNMKGFDFGLNIVAGYQFNNGLFVAANFNQGFSNLVPSDIGEGSMKSHYVGLRLGYLLKWEE